MACCLCFFKASKKSYWPRIALVFAATLFSSAGFLHIGVVLVLIIIMFLSTLFLFMTFSKQKPAILDSSLLPKENDTDTCDQETEIDSEEINEQRLFLIGSSKADLHSSESQSKSTTTSTNNNNSSSCEDKHSSSSSDQWPYYINNIKGQKKLEYCSDDEDSLIEIAIPPSDRHFVISSPDLVQKRDYNINYDQQHMIKCCKHHKEDLLAADMINEEDSFIEIDIYMGSIKYCSTFS